MLRILGKASSINVRKVLWTCAALGIPFVREDAAPDLPGLNPNAMVPVIVDGDLVLWESNTICRYLATRYGDGAPASLLPSEAGARARVEMWMDWQATELNNSWRYAFTALVRRRPSHQDQGRIEAGIEDWNKHMGILARHLESGGSYVANSAFSLADIVLALSANRWLMTPMARPDLPAVRAWLERLEEQPGFRDYCGNGLV
jgi:glutathione S-transferase